MDALQVQACTTSQELRTTPGGHSCIYPLLHEVTQEVTGTSGRDPVFCLLPPAGVSSCLRVLPPLAASPMVTDFPSRPTLLF